MKKENKTFKGWLKENKTFLIILCICLCIRFTHVFGINIVSGHSMDTTLHDKQIVLGSSLKSLNREDIVVAKTDKLVIKRIVGLPGETIAFYNGELHINGEVYEEKYLNEDCIQESKSQEWIFTLGEDEYLILGDNRDNSYDGRYYGPISKELILEKIYIQIPYIFGN